MTMGIKQYRPTSPGRRRGSSLDWAEITRRTPEKSLVEKIAKRSGRNNHGRITSRHRGGGTKTLWRRVDFKRDKDGVPAAVAAVEYDPNRSCNIALLHYRDGEKRYILAPREVTVGSEVLSGEKVEIRAGNCMPIRGIPQGVMVHNIELVPGQGGKIARAAGSYAQVMAKEGRYAHLVMPSGEVRTVRLDCRATIGQVGNLDHANVRLGKAGRNRKRGRRPHVRGVAMNPCDHPLGGGEGRSKGGRSPCSSTGVIAKGGKTRSPRKHSSKYIMRRRKK
jgi:large subunit ribosomal protein L2